MSFQTNFDNLYELNLQMSLRRIPCILGIACVLLCAAAQNPVHITTQMNQLLTSSTLQWIPHMQYYNQKITKDIVIGGFDIIEHAVSEYLETKKYCVSIYLFCFIK